MIGWPAPATIVQALVASGMLMALVLAARGPVMRSFGARIAYALWLLPALRLILPPLPGWRTLAIPAFYIPHKQAAVGLVDPATAMQLSGEAAPPPALWHVGPTLPAPVELAPPPAPVHWPTIALAVWLQQQNKAA